MTPFARLTILLLGVACLLPAQTTNMSKVPVGEYLYASEEKLPEGGTTLTVTFTQPDNSRLVLAYGRQFRKDRQSRQGTTETEREHFKPRLAKMSDHGRTATFSRLEPDYYDLLVISPDRMSIHEGISLLETEGEEPAADTTSIPAPVLAGLRATIFPVEGKPGSGWEGFFDTKEFSRLEHQQGQAGILLQQMRLGPSLQESGESVAGCIHSLDLLWLESTKEANSWLLLGRQQLYRAELPARHFFQTSFLPALQGVRCGLRPRRIGPLSLEP